VRQLPGGEGEPKIAIAENASRLLHTSGRRSHDDLSSADCNSAHPPCRQETPDGQIAWNIKGCVFPGGTNVLCHMDLVLDSVEL
jgi:hypothetical protein